MTVPPFDVRLKTTDNHREVETFGRTSWVHGLWGVRELVLVSCFFDPDWMAEMRERLAKQSVMIVHLNRPPSGSRQLSDLAAFLKKANRRGKTEVFVHTARGGLFHSKMYLLRRRGGTVTYVGSANATRPGFEGNEEVLIEVSGVNPPNGVEGYLKSLSRTGARLNDHMGALSLEHFLREARLVFKPTRSDPFRLQLKPVREAPDAPTSARGLVYSPTGATFNLWVAVDQDSNGESEHESDVAMHRLRPCAIETAYGFWVPIPYYEQELKPTFEEASKKKIKKLTDLRQKLKAQRKDLRIQFESALKEVKTLSDDERQKKRTSFDKLMNTSLERLENPSWLQAHAKNMYQAVVPDLFSDPDSRVQFVDSFLDDLVLRDGEGRRPRVVRALTKGIEKWAAEFAKRKAVHDRGWFNEALRTMLRGKDFSTEKLWRGAGDEE
jgi:hypothetical protein